MNPLALVEPRLKAPFVSGVGTLDPAMAGKEPDDVRNPANSLARELAAHCEFDGILIEWLGADGFPPKTVARSGGLVKSEIISSDQIAPMVRTMSADRGSAVIWADEQTTMFAVRARSGWFLVTGQCRAVRPMEADRCRERLVALLPLLKAMFGVLYDRIQLECGYGHLALAIEHSDVATIILRDDCSIAFANPAAKQIMGTGKGIALSNDKLVCSGVADMLRLQTAVAHLCREGTKTVEPSPILAVERAGRRPLLIGLIPIDSSDPKLSHCATCIAYICDPERNLSELIEPICSYFNLTQRETKLVALLIEGTPLCEVADHMSISEQTARSYLKQIFAKTETHRQMELVQLVLRSSIRMIAARRSNLMA